MFEREYIPPPTEDAARVTSLRRLKPKQQQREQQQPPRQERQQGAQKPQPLVSATPFKWRDPKTIPPREWIYGRHYIRQFASTTVAPGGVGKTNLAIVEALAICTGRDLLGVTPNERTKVWLWNGEDPRDELERRVGAAMMFYGIRSEEIEGWLFLDSGRDSPISLAEQTREGTRIATVVEEAMEATIRANGIGVVILDPFVSVHQVSENDNGAIDAVAKTINRIAQRTNCAFGLNHHVRKTNGAEATVEDGRGAVALLSAARAARTINQMTQAEADKWGVENRRLHFRTFDGKANLAPPSENSTWFKLESIDLGNATDTRPSDWIGVVAQWEPPKHFDDVTADHMHEVRHRIADGQWRLDPQSPDWVGKCVAEVLSLDLSDKAAKAKVKTIIKTWIETGALKSVDKEDRSRKLRAFVIPGDFEEPG
ncbi:AAA family ATPase [Microvirga sp. VF16]|uniref:ATP-binding protein n=1 Tax=Microvirga sp. VF16 TaxID=2807101 RepID=UPI00193CC8DF|nr:AAA family ATPase [Microvirga sp. VF16]QRM28683.1 AAA family ATPase [Microvirga sp. VF16]